MEAIKQAIQAMLLEQLKEAGLKADVRMLDGAFAGLVVAHMTKDSYHVMVTVRAIDSLAAVDSFLLSKVWEFKAILSTRDEEGHSHLLLFFRSWIKWAEGGDAAPNPVGYSQRYGLCYAAKAYERWKKLPENPVTEPLQQLLHDTIPTYCPASGKDTPFNSGPDEYANESKCLVSHRNVRRQRWVIEMIAKLEAK